MESKNTAVLFANTDWYLFNFRLSLARYLKANGFSIQLISPSGKYGESLKAEGFEWTAIAFTPGRRNVLREIWSIFRIIQFYRQVRPVVVHHFTLKCVLYGSIAAIFTGRPAVVNSITGLGHLFTDNRFKSRILRFIVSRLCRFSLRSANSHVIFQNSSDQEAFVSTGIIAREKTHLVRGSGVNCRKFCPEPNSDGRGREEGPVRILFASRMIKEKGIYELVESFRILRASGLACELLLAGDVYPDNPSSLSVKEIDELKRVKGVTYLGHVDDMVGLLRRSDIVALPSYNEGTPRILLEAGALAKPMVATDIPGCMGVVVDGENGFLVPPGNVQALVKALEKLVVDPVLRKRFALRSREIIIKDFEESAVLEKTLAVYQLALKNR